jgi:WD40 repeat protein
MGTQSSRYAGFISYSQKDKKWAKRIHKALESYRLPIGLPDHLKPRQKLGRFFRDDDELSGAPSLGNALNDALYASRALIVICSPHSAQSKWVDAEIRHFKRRGDKANVFAIIVGGSPDAKDPDQRCFAPSLLVKVNDDGSLSDIPDEPLAPNVTKDSFAKLITRVVAGLTGLEFDTLWQREKRRVRQRRLVTGAASMALVVAGFFAISSVLSSQAEKRVQQSITLAGEAHKAMDEGRDQDALDLVLQALPADLKNARQVPTPQALAALTRLMADSPDQGVFAKTGEPIRELRRVDESTISALLDTGRTLVWDADTGAPKHSATMARFMLDLSPPLAASVISHFDDPSKHNGYSGQTVQVHDVSTGALVRNFENASEKWRMSGNFSPDGGLVLATNDLQGQEPDAISIWSLHGPDQTPGATRKFTAPLPDIGPDQRWQYYFANTQTLFFSWGGHEAGIGIWQFTQGQPTLLQMPDDPVPCAGSSRFDGPYGDQVRLSADNSTLSIARPVAEDRWCISSWDADTGAALDPRLVAAEPKQAEDPEPDGIPVLEFTWPKLARAGYFSDQWHPYCAGFYIKSIHPERRISMCAAGKQVIAQAGSHFVPHSPFSGHEAEITALAFDPSFGRIWSADENGTIRNWQLPHVGQANPVRLSSVTGGGRLAILKQKEDGSVRGFQILDKEASPVGVFIPFQRRPDIFTMTDKPEGDTKLSTEILQLFENTSTVSAGFKQAVQKILQTQGETVSAVETFAEKENLDQDQTTFLSNIAEEIDFKSFYESASEPWDTVQAQLLAQGTILGVLEGTVCEPKGYCPPVANSRVSLYRVRDGKLLHREDGVLLPQTATDPSVLQDLVTSQNGQTLALLKGNAVTLFDLIAETVQARLTLAETEQIIEGQFADESWWFLSLNETAQKISLWRQAEDGTLTAVEHHGADEGRLLVAPDGQALLIQYMHDRGWVSALSVYSKKYGLQAVNLPKEEADRPNLLVVYPQTPDQDVDTLRVQVFSASYSLEPPAVLNIKTAEMAPFDLPVQNGLSGFTTLVKDPLGRAVLYLDNEVQHVLPLMPEQPICPSLHDQPASSAAISADGTHYAYAWRGTVRVFDLDVCVPVLSRRYTKPVGDLSFVDPTRLWVQIGDQELDIIRLDFDPERLLAQARAMHSQ